MHLDYLRGFGLDSRGYGGVVKEEVGVCRLWDECGLREEPRLEDEVVEELIG